MPGFVVLAMALSACGASKKVSKSEKQLTTQQEIEEARAQLELEKAKYEIEAQRIELEAKNRRLQAQFQAVETMEDGTQVLLTFCIDDAKDNPGEYLAGLGISRNQLDQKDALISANQVALSDISSRFLGAVKNGIEFYNNETNTRERQQAKESDLEGLAMAVGEKAINKFANVVCRKIISEKEGTYGCYVAVHVPVGEVVDEIADELDVLQVKVDKERFKENLLQQLESDSQEYLTEQQKRKEQMQSGIY